MFKQFSDRLGATISIDRIGVEISCDDKRGLGRKCPGPSVIVDDISTGGISGHIVHEQSDFVVISASVSVFRTVEYRGSRVTCNQVQGFAADEDRNVPMGFRAESELIPNRIGVIRFAFCGPWGRSHGTQRAGHLAPAKVLEGPNRLRLDFVATEYRHAILARKVSESPSVVGLMQFAVSIQIESGIDPCVDGSCKEVLPWRLLGFFVAILA